MSSSALPESGFDTSSFTNRPSKRDVRQFWQSFRHVSGARQPGRGARIALVTLGVVVIPVGLLAMSTGIGQELAAGEPDMAGQLSGMAAVMLLFVIAGFVMTWWLSRVRARRRSKSEFYRLAHFAAANQLSYAPGLYDASHLRPWAGDGRQLRVVDTMRTASHMLEFGNLESIDGAGRWKSTAFSGYAALRIGTSLPNIRLESTRVRRGPRQYSAARDQQLSLEGDFDRHFTLYCPAGYERDALYLFTPDVMALLIDNVTDFDIELIDDWVFVSSPKDVVTLDADRWNKLDVALRAVFAKIGQWSRWRDERVPDNRLRNRGAVASSGRRLKLGWGSGTFLAVFLGTVYLALVIISNTL